MTLLLENEILLVAATDLELCGHPGLVCGVGPVEAAASTSRELAMSRPRAVINIGIAGSKGLTPGSVVIGSEAFYTDLGAEIPVVDRIQADPELIAEIQSALPEAVVIPIATSAFVTGSLRAAETFRAEGMEGFGVLRACQLAGVPGVELRVISNDIGEGNRALWMMRRALEVLDGIIPRLPGARRSPLAASRVSPWRGERRPRAESCRLRSLPSVRTVGQLVGEAIRIYGRNPWQSLAIGVPVAVVNAFVWGASGSAQVVIAAAGAFLVTVSYVVACAIVTGASLRSRSTLVAYLLGVLIFVPFPLLASLFILPGLLWLSLFGLAVPVALVEGLGIRAALHARSQVGARGHRPCSRRPCDARTRRLPHPGFAVLRPA